MQEVQILSGRSCKDCTMCCKVLTITELDKPQGKWCDHCNIGKGCKIYDQRPDVCRKFHCGYLFWPKVGDHWFPARSKLVIMTELDGQRITVFVDTSRPDAWREQPYYGEIKQWAAFAADNGLQVVVSVGGRAIVVLPDRDVDVGLVEPGDQIFTLATDGPAGAGLEVVKLKADDPRTAGLIAMMQAQRQSLS